MICAVSFILPQDLSYCVSCITAEDAFSALKSHSIEQAIQFFECGADDETWTKEFGGELLGFLFQWFNLEFLNHRLSIEYTERIAAKVQEHVKVLTAFMVADIDFLLAKEMIPASSLMFGASSAFFRELIWRDIFIEKREAVQLPKIPRSQFQMIQEFVYTGTLPNLWKEEPETILSLLRQARTWQIGALEEFSAGVFKRYLTVDNVWDYFALSKQEILPSLEQECCQFLNRKLRAITLTVFDPYHMGAEITRFADDNADALQRLSPYITHITVSSEAAADPAFATLLASKQSLTALNLAGTSSIHPDCLNKFPTTSSLDLS